MENKDIIKRFFDLLSDGEIIEAFELVDEKVNWWIPGNLPFSGHKSKEQYMEVVDAIKKGFPGGFRLTVLSMIAEGNKVAAEVESAGIHITGRNYHNKYHFLFELENGKITSVKEYMDTLHLFQLLQPVGSSSEKAAEINVVDN
jgi:ketosteroid isomerase-like protein